MEKVLQLKSKKVATHFALQHIDAGTICTYSITDSKIGSGKIIIEMNISEGLKEMSTDDPGETNQSYFFKNEKNQLSLSLITTEIFPNDNNFNSTTLVLTFTAPIKVGNTTATKIGNNTGGTLVV